MFSRGKENRLIEKKIEQILCENYNSYYRMAYSFVKNESDAADIVQEGAYRAIKQSDSLKEIDYAATWVYRIMMNEIYRFTKKKTYLSFDKGTFLEPAKEDTYENVDLKRALESMDSKDRTVIQLKYFEELKLEEIAEILDENISTVKSRLYRGLKKLRKAL